jgi:hypothetical protein
VVKNESLIQGCMIGIPEAAAIILTTAKRTELEGLVRSTKTEHRLRQRAGIVLVAVSMKRATEAPRQNTRWNPANASGAFGAAEAQGLCPLVGTALGRSARRCRCAVYLAHSACPEDLPGANPGARATIRSSPPRTADVLGLYMAPPENAIVICIESPRPRLFAAFEVATGKVTAAHKKRRRRIEFFDFMNDIVAVWPTPPSTSTTSIPTNQKTTFGSSSIRT